MEALMGGKNGNVFLRCPFRSAKTAYAILFSPENGKEPQSGVDEKYDRQKIEVCECQLIG